MKKYIIIRTQFEAIHSWPDCPIEEVSFLKNPHRHIFHVEIKIKVSHNNRDVEFIQAKRILNEFLQQTYNEKDIGHLSCEMICEDIQQNFAGWSSHSISVFEDNENGAEIIFDEM